MYSPSIDGRSCEANRTFSGMILLTMMLLIQGCASDPVYRGVSPQQAEEYVARIAGTTKPSGVTLAEFYQKEDKWVSWKGAWNCNNQLTRVEIRNAVLKAGPGNFVQGTESQEGDCISETTFSIAGRYDGNYFYMYLPSGQETSIYKYEIAKSGWPKGKLIYRGLYQYVDDVWTFFDAGDNPRFWITGQSIPESGGPADMWESSEWLPQSSDPRLTSAKYKQERARELENEASGAASEIAGRQALRDAEEREESHAANIAAFNKVAQDFAAENGQRGAGAGAIVRDIADGGGSGASDHSQSDSRQGGGEYSTKQTLRKKYVQNGFNDGGARAITPELAIEKDVAQLKAEAEKWVAERMNGSVSANAVITGMKVREGCTAYKQIDSAGGYWAKCILDITYESD